MANSGLIGSSERFQAVLDDVQVVAPAECAVLVQGETGTGKEVIARAIHDSGPRQSGPFVGLNCAAIPGALLESELFGHERGAFTGAVTQTIGRFQAAHGMLTLQFRGLAAFGSMVSKFVVGKERPGHDIGSHNGRSFRCVELI
jgi:transcriptional regulator with GAF, ATPase, and Fis domain